MLEKLKALITEYVEVEADDITEESRFAEDLGFNSYDFMCMLGDAEDTFDVSIEEGEASRQRTVGDLLNYLEGLRG